MNPLDTASTDSLTGAWLSLPAPLKAKLRLGFTGTRHLLDIAAWCMASGAPTLNPIALDALETALRENPLNGILAQSLLANTRVKHLLSQDKLNQLAIVTTHYRPPTSPDDSLSPHHTADIAAQQDAISRHINDTPNNLYWLEQGIQVGLFAKDTKKSAELYEFITKPGVKRVFKTAIDTIFKDRFSIKDTQDHNFLKKVGTTPWNTNRLLRTYDALTGVADEKKPVPGSVAILIHSSNNADGLDATLTSLIESDISEASLFIMDHGSTDRTPAILKTWAGRFATRFGPNHCSIITLPIPIGNPAAKNWLLHLDAVRDHDFICLLDDAVTVAPDWLSRLGTAVLQYPDAGVWGGKLVNHANHNHIISTDHHLLVEPDAVMNLSRLAPNPFSFSALHSQTRNSTTFEFMRPCAAFSGGCHLFRTPTLLETGDFAIQLSPADYDTTEYAIRLCSRGLFPVCHGHLPFHTLPSTHIPAMTGIPHSSNALGNRYKMQTMYDVEEIQAIAAAEHATLDADILTKLQFFQTVR
ncbi:glycosyltransferase [Pseudodesulfovibrio sp. JC047]|uniref:glycosyltransferase family A protein n=1 Tax=Pseudodesulfovibrio sp. JC047 TaxID=2683199 RepID=UPI0013D40A46|nr:glycosyltransferase family A protein [Pseudodesulfovibrio sp. JC047]NDV20410.1 glycosyltransferase [Pseudodesulfovibrio sp. JC047]